MDGSSWATALLASLTMGRIVSKRLEVSVSVDCSAMRMESQIWLEKAVVHVYCIIEEIKERDEARWREGQEAAHICQ